MDTEFHFDVLVIGAGHAGCEAAHAAATMGVKTCRNYGHGEDSANEL
jgi:tRNA uridine 5-carboxymethylaminomethyl modification enzyme